MNYKQYFKKHKKTLQQLKVMFERDEKTKISLEDFSRYMYRQSTDYKIPLVNELYKYITKNLDLNEMNKLVGLLNDKLNKAKNKKVV